MIVDMKSPQGQGDGDMVSMNAQPDMGDAEPPAYSLSSPGIPAIDSQGPIASSSSVIPPHAPQIPQSQLQPQIPTPAQRPSPTNFLYVQRSNVILRGTYVIDPTLDVPAGMLPILKRFQERKNLHLDTRNGAIKADVYLEGSGAVIPGQYVAEGVPRKRPTTIEATTRNGLITMKMNCENEHLFNLHISVHNGSISLAVPRGYRGGLSIRTKKAWIQLSPSFSANISTTSEMKGKTVYFVHDHDTNSTLADLASSIDLRIRGGLVKVCYTDEMPDADQGGENQGFLSKLLGIL